ncbi:MAG TPA: dTDP-4-dehydrorhamnose reductase [Chitinophagaceae bacterium]|nr:dTDP-4-dehydrorhamnose reductase [Chitinophagaceae bacterium]
MQKPTILVSGKNGQLGNELQDASVLFPQFHYRFFGRDELDICNINVLEKIFEKYKPAYFINTAAYTAVDKAEAEQEAAYLINAEAVCTIAKICSRYSTVLIQLSTDYVFDGNNKQPYKEEDATNPVNYYGYSKWMGEQLALENNPETIVIRSSWVYSVYGHNFVKTMLHLMKERATLNVVNDQFGSPTYAKDLAEAILQIITNCSLLIANCLPGIYHFSNDGVISWYDFATAIRDIKKLNCLVQPITTAQYPTPAKRPAYSVLNKEKIQSTFHIVLKNWRGSLEECLGKL